MKNVSSGSLALVFALLGAVLFCLPTARTALAAGACPESARAAADGPQPQDIEAALAADKKSVTATIRFAPCPQRYASVEFSFSLFDRDGAFLGIGAQDTPSTAQGVPNPQVIIPVQGVIAVDPASADRLLTKLLVQVMWEACPDTGGINCAQMAWHFRSFLMDVPSFTPAHR